MRRSSRIWTGWRSRWGMSWSFTGATIRERWSGIARERPALPEMLFCSNEFQEGDHMSLFATKPLDLLMKEGQESGEHSLKRTLGPFQLTALGVGAIIGAGIFVLSGLGAH